MVKTTEAHIYPNLKLITKSHLGFGRDPLAAKAAALFHLQLKAIDPQNLHIQKERDDSIISWLCPI